MKIKYFPLSTIEVARVAEDFGLIDEVEDIFEEFEESSFRDFLN